MPRKRNAAFVIEYVVLSYGTRPRFLCSTLNWNEAVKQANMFRKLGELCNIYKMTRG